MRRCFRNLDVSSQRQYSVRQRRDEILTENEEDAEEPSEANETQQENEVYHVNIYDDSQPAYQFTREATQVPERRGRQNSRSAPYSLRGSGSRGSSGSRRSGGSSGSRGPRRRQNFESTIQETMTTIRDFQKESFERLRPGYYDPADYDDFNDATAILNSLNVPVYMGKFYMKCLSLLRHDRFWRRHWMNASHFPDIESRFLFLESLTECTRYGEDTGNVSSRSSVPSSRSSEPSSSGSVSAGSSQRLPSMPIAGCNPPATFSNLGFARYSQGSQTTRGVGEGSTYEHPFFPPRRAPFQDTSHEDEDEDEDEDEE